MKTQNSQIQAIRERVLRDPTTLPGSLIDPASKVVVSSAANLAKGLDINVATIAGWARMGRLALVKAGDSSLYAVAEAASLAIVSRRGRPRKVDPKREEIETAGIAASEPIRVIKGEWTPKTTAQALEFEREMAGEANNTPIEI